MKKIFIVFILGISCNSFAQSWVLVASDNDSRLLVDKSSIKKVVNNVLVNWKIEFSKLNSTVFNKSLLNCPERESSLLEMIVMEPSGNTRKMDTNNLGWEFVPKSDKAASLAFDYVCSRNLK